MKPRLTILLGAGSTLNLGVNGLRGMPSTNDLTTRISRMRMPLVILPGTQFVQSEVSDPKPFQVPRSASALHVISRALRSTFSEVNFELILHAIEQLLPFAGIRFDAEVSHQMHPTIAAFSELLPRYKELNDWSLLMVARQLVIGELRAEILNRQLPSSADLPLQTFIRNLAQDFQLALFTLNYDEVVDYALGNWFDGFCGPITNSAIGPAWEAASFDSKSFNQWRSTDAPLLVHLHGSVRFGPYMGAQEFVKYRTALEATSALQSISGSIATTGGQITAADPIISGLNKAARLTLNPVPYGYYYRAFIDALLSTERLLVIGYSGNDEHVNTWLGQFIATHGVQRRVAWIGKLTGKMCGERTAEKGWIGALSDNKFQDFVHNDARSDADVLFDLGKLRLGVSGFPITPQAQNSLVSFFA